MPRSTLFLFYVFLILVFCSCKKTPVSLVGWGDSMMVGALSPTSMLEEAAYQLDSLPFINHGIGGLTSEQVAALQGGIPFMVQLKNQTMEVSGEQSIVAFNIAPYNGQTFQDRKGSLDGIEGRIRRYSHSQNRDSTVGFSFLRHKRGWWSRKTAPFIPFVFDEATTNDDRAITLIWVGRNDPDKLTAPQKTVSNIQKMVSALGAYASKHYLIISVCNGHASVEGLDTDPHKEITHLNKALQKEFGEHYVDLRRYMVKEAIFDAVKTPSDLDLMDMEKDGIPRRFLADSVHFNTLGYKMAGRFIATEIRKRNWLEH